MVKKSTSVIQQTDAQQTDAQQTDAQQTDGKSLIIEIDGYDYTIVDIVKIKSEAPNKGDIVVFDPYENKSMCLSMGSTMALGKIVGLPDDTVQIQKNDLKSAQK